MHWTSQHFLKGRFGNLFLYRVGLLQSLQSNNVTKFFLPSVILCFSATQQKSSSLERNFLSPRKPFCLLGLQSKGRCLETNTCFKATN